MSSKNFLYGYHVTPLTNLTSILKRGLVPGVGARSSKIGEMKPGIYFFPSKELCEDGLMNWLGDELSDDEVVILEMNLAGLLQEVGADYELIITSKVDPQRISAVYDENWVPLSINITKFAKHELSLEP